MPDVMKRPRVQVPPKIRTSSYLDDVTKVVENQLAKRASGGASSSGSRLGPRSVEDSLKEARFAVEEVALRRGQPVDLLPRPEELINLQVELVNSYRLSWQVISNKDGKQRLRILPPGDSTGTDA